MPRRYIRHPSDIPISLTLEDESLCDPHLQNISVGGLCCSYPQALSAGAQVRIEIDFISPHFHAYGQVLWSRPDRQGYLIGIGFSDPHAAHAMRMVQQVCRIEQYRERIYQEQGLSLSSEEAARQWIERYAADFPML